MNQNNNTTLPTNDQGENWTDAIRAYGKRHGNTPEQIAQQIDRAQVLIIKGYSVANAVETARRTLAIWRQIKSDDATFEQRRPHYARASRLWRVEA